MSSFLNNKLLGNQILIPNQSLLYLTGATWAIDGNGRAYNTPTLGSELLANGDMETGSPPSNWLNTGASGVATADAYAGIQANLVTANQDGNSDRIRQECATTPHTWLYAECYAKRGVGTSQGMRINGVLVSTVVLGSTAYEKYCCTDRSNSTSTQLFLYAAIGGSIGDTAYFDNVSMKQIATTSLVAHVQGSQYQTPVVRLYNIIDGTQAGVIGWLDNPASPANFVIAIRNGAGNVNLTKCVAGTYTNLISISSTFVADAAIEIRRPSGNTFQLWYNGSQIGTDQTINDTAIADNATPHYGLFSTYSGNTFSEFRLDGNLVPFGF